MSQFNNQDKSFYFEKKEEISRKHLKNADKCGKSMIKMGESLQKANNSDNSDKEVGKSLVERGKKILNYMHLEAEKVEQAKKEENSSFDYYESAAEQRRKATKEHTEAVKEYNQLLQKKIETKKKLLEKHDC